MSDAAAPPSTPAASPAAPAAASAAPAAPVLGGEPAAPAAPATAASTPAADPKAPVAAAPVVDKAAEDKLWSEWQPKGADGKPLDAALLKDFTPLARELGITPEKAQKLVDFQAQQQAASVKSMLSNLEKEREGWLNSLKGDKDLGGEKLDGTIRTANKAFEKFVDADTKKWLTATGLDAHPGLIRAFHAVGAAMADDSIAGTSRNGAAAPSPESQLKALYPNSPSMFAKP